MAKKAVASNKQLTFGKRKVGKAKKHKNKREDRKKYRGQGR
jgi:hypothetical protein